MVALKQKLESATPSKAAWVRSLAKLITAEPQPVTNEGLRLYVTLALLADPESGRVMLARSDLSRFLDRDSSALLQSLEELQKHRVLTLKSPGPYLVVSIRLWSDKTTKQSAEQEFGQDLSIAESAEAESRSDLQGSASTNPADSAEADLQPGGDRPPSQATFVERLMAAIGAADERTSYETFCAAYPPEILEKALARVKQTPAERIRKSRGALFIYLVKNFAKQRHDH